jgi:hypothetical protein
MLGRQKVDVPVVEVVLLPRQFTSLCPWGPTEVSWLALPVAWLGAVRELLVAPAFSPVVEVLGGGAWL